MIGSARALATASIEEWASVGEGDDQYCATWLRHGGTGEIKEMFAGDLEKKTFFSPDKFAKKKKDYPSIRHG
jgi:hypothetical protein